MFKKMKNNRGDGRVDDITSREHDVSSNSLLEGQHNFVEHSAFQAMIDMESANEANLLPARRKMTLNKKRNASNIRKNVVKNGQLAPLQISNHNGRGMQVGHKSAAPQRLEKKGSDYVHVYTTSLPLTQRLK